MVEISPLAPSEVVTLPPVKGVRFSAASAGVKYKDRLDVMLMHFESGSVLAGVFTKSATRSAPVLWSQDILGGEGDQGFAILANSGNSNAFTGEAGEEALARCVQSVAGELNLPHRAVHMASTGVIGEVLPDEKVTAVVPQLVKKLGDKNADDAAKAVMTTDTFAKTATQTVDLDGVSVTISGFAKGSGMIAPDMATMLGFIATDIKIDRAVLQGMLTRTTEKSFNAITVDSDTSTSDSVYIGATGKANMEPINDITDPRSEMFEAALGEVMTDLAHQIVRDGEGASKFVTVHVTGANNGDDAKAIAMAIANSPLVKTAVAGADPNWGRLVMAVGKSGAKADRDRLTITIGGEVAARDGQLSPDYSEENAAEHMRGAQVNFKVDLGLGDAEFTAYTCDFTRRYIEINADYRS